MNLKQSIVFCALMSLSPTAFSQSYVGTANDLNTIFNPPSEIQGTICQNTKNDGNEHSGDVCRDGVSAARWMAEKYAQKAGQYLGCVDGFTQGVWDGYIAAKNPSADMTKEAQAYINQATLDSAVDRGIKRAENSAITESADEIIRRYRDVIRLKNQGQQVYPNKTPDLSKIPDFKGFDNGYEHDLANNNIEGGNFSGPINANYINANSSFEDKIAAKKAYLFQGERAQDLCDVSSTIFGRHNLPQFTIWDYFKAQRQVDFQNYGWKNANWAWDIYTNDERTLAQFQNYEGIKNLEKDEILKTPITETKLKLDANGNPILIVDAQGNAILDANGQKQYEMYEEIVDYEITTRRVKLNSNDVRNLQNIYRTAFVESYSRYYARQYASLKYHTEGLDKYELALQIGRALGDEVAYHTARKTAYDTKYKADSRSAYDVKAEALYLKSFNDLINVFENNPVVELDEIYINGETQDDIYRRGENLSADFTVTNLGEVGGDVNIKLTNTRDVIANGGITVNPDALSQQSFQSGVIGQISNDALLKDEVIAELSVKNPSFLNKVSRELNIFKVQGLYIRDYAEIRKVDYDLRLLDGELDVIVDVLNASGVEAPAMPNVSVKVNGTSIATDKDMLKIGAGDTDDVTLSLNGLDPIDLIQKGAISITVEVTIGSNNKLIDRKTIDIRTNGNAAKAYAKYFDSLVTGKISNTGNLSKAERIAEIVEQISLDIDDDLRNQKIRWRKQDHVNRTIVADLQVNYRASKAAGMIDQDAQSYYDELALILAKKTNNKGRMRIRGFDKHYLRALKVVSPSLSTRWRDHKN